MKLLILTQKVAKNDDVLGFFHQWIIEFARHCEKVTIICLEKREFNLPSNVEVISLGKEIGAGKLMRFVRLYYHVYAQRNEYVNVFVHMNPEYIVFCGWLWKKWNKKIALWYTHKSVNDWLLRAEKRVDVIFTASSESFRLLSDKVRVMGHGIDTDFFKPTAVMFGHEMFSLMSIGRLSSSKGHEMIIAAVDGLRQGGADVRLMIVGSAATKQDEQYAQMLVHEVQTRNLERVVEFTGPVPHEEVRGFLVQTDVLVHASETGSMDKTVLEALACGVPVVSSSEAYSEMLHSILPALFVHERSPTAFVDAIKNVMWLPRDERKRIGARLREIVQREHSLPVLITNLVARMNQL
jgi:glycosyltransferase involved in cell wall biosynthesis